MVKAQTKTKPGPKSKKQNRTIMTGRMSCGKCSVNYHSSHKTTRRVWLCSRKNSHSSLCQSDTITEIDILKNGQKGFEQKYNLSKANVVKDMISDIKNLKDRFEYRRLLHFLELERIKEEELEGVGKCIAQL
ncbi:hypothetical protein KHA80_12490 [Anaerobacillus sp. HL2]|nr:hypothetical protein KHA80_12490 [Anaerobacillus sp. HL2]